MIEICKVKNELAPPIMDSMFEKKSEHYITFVIFKNF